jgi:mRNA interferase RelE/StbE
MRPWRLSIPPAVAERIAHLEPQLKQRVRAALRALALEPRRGEALQRELSDYRKYRVGRYRIVFALDPRRRLVRVMAVGHRRRIYEELAELAKSR